jgi:hypothetical protein
MPHLRYARLLAAVVLFAPACGKSSSSDEDNPAPVVIYQVKDIQLTALQVDARNERDGELTNDVTVQVNFPIHIDFGITQTGGNAVAQYSFGLMEQVADGAGDGTQHTCFLGSTSANHPGDGSERHYEATFIVPPECVTDNEPVTYNLYAGLDVPGQVDKTDAEDDGNVVIYNQDMLEETRNQQCKTGDGTVGCIMTVTVNPSPGVNLTFASMVPESSVAILEPLDETTGGTDDAGKAVAEVHTPFVKVVSTLTLAGVNTDDETAITDKNAAVAYSVCAESLFHDTCSGAGWLPLTIATADTANKRSGHAAKQPVAKLKTGEPSIYAHLLFAEGDTFEAMATGAWSSETNFVVRGCLTSDVEEKAVGTDDGTVAKLDNCTTRHVTIVRADQSFRKSFATRNNFTGGTTAYTFTENLVQRVGDANTIQVGSSMATDNVMNLDGASSRNELSIDLAGKVNIKAAQTIAKAAAYVSLIGSYVEIQQNMLQVALYSFRKEVAEYTKTEEKGYVREGCATFGYNALVIVLQGSMCVGGQVVMKGTLTIAGSTGGKEPFGTAQKTGLVSVQVGPESDVHAITSVVGDAAVARGTLEGTLRLIEMTAPVTASLQWGLTSLNPPAVAIVGKVTSTAGLAVLDGNIRVFADLRSIDMCSKSWKICGHRFRMSYPCGFSWNRAFDQTLVNFTGDNRNVTLLSRSQTMTLQ